MAACWVRPCASTATLEGVLQTELDHSCVPRHPCRALARAGHPPEIVRIADIQPRGSQVHVVEEVEELRSELHAVRLKKAEVFRGREVHLIKAGQVDGFARRRPELSRSGECE